MTAPIGQVAPPGGDRPLHPGGSSGMPPKTCRQVRQRSTGAAQADHSSSPRAAHSSAVMA